MFHQTSGVVEVICGSMFSGKTEELLRRVRRAQFARQKVQVFKPKLDDRYSEDHVQSHDANRFQSQVVEHSSEILDLIDDITRVVGLDEAQFFDDGILDVVNKLANRGIRVIVAGLDMDYLGNPFGIMPTLLAVAETVTKLQAVCMVCGGPASRSQRLIDSDEKVLVGAQEFYEPRCRIHHELDPAMSPPAPLTQKEPTPVREVQLRKE